jgi:hypothetical protein
VNVYNKNPIHVTTKSGGVLLMDSNPLHEVIVEELIIKPFSATDGHGTYMTGRNSLVIMANKQYGNYVSQKYTSAVFYTTSKKGIKYV